MCGINGIISWHRPSEQIVRSMNKNLCHRGPDDEGVFSDEEVSLGHVRLSILDLTRAGAQPMKFKQWVLVYNGEIYNFKTIQNELLAKGYEFQSRCDTEVLLKAWDLWGQDCLHRFDGMFAFAILNTLDRSIHLCRDSYGVKPLFYSSNKGEFLFSSELTTLIHAQLSAPKLDHDAISTFIALHYIPTPQTGLKGIHKLPAGHCLAIRFSQKTLKISNPVSWGSEFTPIDSPNRPSLNELNSVLEKSVRSQMISDVPVGAFLSGGVDSSLICYYASKAHREPLHTFSIGFSDAGLEYDETAYAAQAAKIIGSRHHAVQVELGGLTARIDEILHQMGELNADTSVPLNFIICEEARKYVTVCLSGAGGDELFGGYFRHQAFLGLGLLNRIPTPIIRGIRNILQHLPQHRDSQFGNLARRINRFIDQQSHEPPNFLNLLRQDSFCPQDSHFLKQPPVDTLLKALKYDFNHFLGDNILNFSDKMSMLHGLEVRVPFLNPNVVKFAEHMSNNQRVTLSEKKVLLKQLAVRYFPRNLIYRRKKGFAAPLEVWLRQLKKSDLRKRCSSDLTATFFQEHTIDQLIDNFIDYRKDLSLQIYALIVMNQWYQHTQSKIKKSII